MPQNCCKYFTVSLVPVTSLILAVVFGLGIVLLPILYVRLSHTTKVRSCGEGGGEGDREVEGEGKKYKSKGKEEGERAREAGEGRRGRRQGDVDFGFKRGKVIGGNSRQTIINTGFLYHSTDDE